MRTPLRRYYRGHNLVGMRDVPASSTRYYHFDHQGTTQCLTDSTGTVTDRFAADAWGVEVKRTGTSINRQWYAGGMGGYTQGVLVYAAADQYYEARMGRWLATSREVEHADHTLLRVHRVPPSWASVTNANARPHRRVCAPEDLTCLCSRQGGKPHCSTGSFPPSDPLYRCYLASCKQYCRERDRIDGMDDLYCTANGIRQGPLAWAACLSVNLWLRRQVTPTDDCDGCYVAPDIIGGGGDLPGWWFLPCCQECRARVCCWIQTPLWNKIKESLKDQIALCNELIGKTK